MGGMVGESAQRTRLARAGEKERGKKDENRLTTGVQRALIRCHLRCDLQVMDPQREICHRTPTKAYSEPTNRMRIEQRPWREKQRASERTRSTRGTSDQRIPDFGQESVGEAMAQVVYLLQCPIRRPVMQKLPLHPVQVLARQDGRRCPPEDGRYCYIRVNSSASADLVVLSICLRSPRSPGPKTQTNPLRRPSGLVSVLFTVLRKPRPREGAPLRFGHAILLRR